MTQHDNPMRRKIKRKAGENFLCRGRLAQSQMLIGQFISEGKQNDDIPQPLSTKPSRAHSACMLPKSHYLAQLQNCNRKLRQAITQKTEQIDKISKKINYTQQKYQTLIQNQTGLMRERVFCISSENSIIQQFNQPLSNSTAHLSRIREKLMGINMKNE